jgi:hypothetical protein
VPIIEPLSVSSLDYLRSFNLKCIALSKTGRLFTCDNPAGAVCAWWAKADDIDRIAAIAWPSGDVPGAAAKLGLVATPHSVVAKRTAERTARIEAALQQALNEGTLKMFNREFGRRRLEAQRAGRKFMTYQTAHTKLRRVVTEMVSRGGLVTQSLIASVFDAK